MAEKASFVNFTILYYFQLKCLTQNLSFFHYALLKSSRMHKAFTPVLSSLMKKILRFLCGILIENSIKSTPEFHTRIIIHSCHHKINFFCKFL